MQSLFFKQHLLKYLEKGEIKAVSVTVFKEDCRALYDTIWTLEDDSYVDRYDGLPVLDTEVLNLRSISGINLMRVPRAKDPTTTNCIICAVEEYLNKYNPALKISLREVPTQARLYSEMCGMDLVETTVVFNIGGQLVTEMVYVQVDCQKDLTKTLYVTDYPDAETPNTLEVSNSVEQSLADYFQVPFIYGSKVYKP